MPEYRVYFVDSDGHFHSSVVLNCPDDEAAKEQAEKLVDGHDVELWILDRKVATFDQKSLDAGNE